ncbi:MAG: hypothetical protein JNK33_06260 [Candidatus Doudnabacteria bacterium]|nr:hypothetical protein [Candidatus Doudnabacteria bacterium]
MKLSQLITWPIGVLILHSLLTVTGGYYWWVHVDKIMHVLGGMSIAVSAVAAIKLYSKEGNLRISDKLVRAIIVLGFVALAAVCWEFLEFSLDHFAYTHMQPSLRDTMGDLLAGLCGGGLIMLIKIIPRQSKT